MNPTENLQPVVEHGWRSGLANLLRKENALWWRTSQWWRVGLAWLVISNSLIFVGLWIEKRLSGQEALLLFIQFQSIIAALGVIVLSQGLIVSERKSGTAAWVLSNPVSRSAYILSKLLSQGGAWSTLLVIVPGLVVYLQASLKDGELFNPLMFMLGLGLLCWFLCFYFVLTVMLGTFFNSSELVTGLSIIILFVLTFLETGLLAVAPEWAKWVPSNLAKLAAQFCLGHTPMLDDYASLLSTTILIVIGLAVALAKFEREEL